MKTFEAVEHFAALARMIADGDWGYAEPWQGADVVVVEVAPAPVPNAWLPDYEYVVTPYVRELSWVFEQARDAVKDHDGYGMFKEEFFGRMGEAVNACGSDVPITTHLNVALFAARFFVESVIGRFDHE